MEILITIIIAVVSFLVILAGLATIASRFYVKVGPDEAIVRTGGGGMKVTTAVVLSSSLSSIDPNAWI